MVRKKALLQIRFWKRIVNYFGKEMLIILENKYISTELDY
jgi:hypothetical protein